MPRIAAFLLLATVALAQSNPTNNQMSVALNPLTISGIPYDTASQAFPLSLTLVLKIFPTCPFEADATSLLTATSAPVTITSADQGTIALDTLELLVDGIDARNSLGVSIIVNIAATQGSGTSPSQILLACSDLTCTDADCGFDGETITQVHTRGTTSLEFNVTLLNGLPNPTPNPCFPEDAEVELESGDFAPMKSVSIGDRVRVAAGSAPDAFSEVFMWGHRVPEGVWDFVEIVTEDGATITLSASHYLYANGNLATARAVLPGDVLTLANGSPAVVAATATVRRAGLYNPMTMSGDIVVNGVKASSYTAAFDPAVVHGLMAPLRMLYKATGWSLRAFEPHRRELEFLPMGAERFERKPSVAAAVRGWFAAANAVESK